MHPALAGRASTTCTCSDHTRRDAQAHAHAHAHAQTHTHHLVQQLEAPRACYSRTRVCPLLSSPPPVLLTLTSPPRSGAGEGVAALAADAGSRGQGSNQSARCDTAHTTDARPLPPSTYATAAVRCQESLHSSACCRKRDLVRGTDQQLLLRCQSMTDGGLLPSTAYSSVRLSAQTSSTLAGLSTAHRVTTIDYRHHVEHCSATSFPRSAGQHTAAHRVQTPPPQRENHVPHTPLHMCAVRCCPAS